MRFDGRTLARGERYFLDGHVTDLRVEETRVFGRVAGTRAKPYTVVLELSRPAMSVCTCPVREECKHLVALILGVCHDSRTDQAVRVRAEHVARASGIGALLDRLGWRSDASTSVGDAKPGAADRAADAARDGATAMRPVARAETAEIQYDLAAELERLRAKASAAATSEPQSRAGGFARHDAGGEPSHPVFVDGEDDAEWRAALLIGRDGGSRRPQVSLARQYRRKDGEYGRLEQLRGTGRAYLPEGRDRAIAERLRVLGGSAPLIAFAEELVRSGLPVFAGDPGDCSGAQNHPVRVIRATSYLVEVTPRETAERLALVCRLHARPRRSKRSTGAPPPVTGGEFDEGMGLSVASFARSGLVLVDSADSPLVALERWLGRYVTVTPRTVVDLLELSERHPARLEVRYPKRIRVVERQTSPVFVLSLERGEFGARLSLEVELDADGFAGDEDDEYLVHVARPGDPSDAIAVATKAIGARPHALVPWERVGFGPDDGPWHWTRPVRGGRPDLVAVARALADAGFTVYVSGPDGRRRVRQAERLAVRVTSGTDWFAPVVSEAGGESLDQILLHELAFRGSIERGNELVLFSAEEIERIRELLELTSDAPKARIPKSDLASLHGLAGLADDVAPDLEPVRELATAILSGRKPRAPKKPAGLTAKLRPYQREGLAWLASLARHGLSGCLADDMGLGKTIEALAFMLHLRETGDARNPGSFLVVAPVTTLGNWQREAARFAPGLSCTVHHGSERVGSANAIAAYDLVVTSYATAMRDGEVLSEVDWRLVVLDEAQAIKNPHARTTRRMKSLPSGLRLCLTGTPVENLSTDLWSIMDFLVPGLLGPLASFTHRFPKRNANGSEQGASRLARLRLIVSPFLLRRTKEAVAPELPPRIESNLSCSMGARQARFYETLRAHHQDQVRRAIESRDIKRIGAAVFTGLLRLRQAAIYPADADRRGAGVPSAKEEELLARLDEVTGEGHRALVFSQFVAALTRFRDAAASRGIETLYLDGSTTRRDRLIDRFQEADGPVVFFISLKAGGTGINLTAADYVFICDPWWNPQVERQAVDRAHRIGRDRPVIVNRLVTTGTIEEKVLELQQQKRALAADLIAENTAGVDLSSADELLALFE